MAIRGLSRVLYGELLRSVAKTLLDDFGTSDRKRLELILDLSTAERLRLSDCLPILFPDVDEAKALKSLTNLRSRFNQIAEEKDVELRFVVDSRKRDAPSNRFCWFEGADPTIEQAARQSDELTADIVDDPLVLPRGIVTTGSALAANKRLVRLFVSYAHDDRDLAEKLIAQYRTQFKASRTYELELWIDREIMAGEYWDERIQNAIRQCDLGLLLVSPAFLTSDYILRFELPHFVGPDAKPAIPAGLVRVNFKAQDLHGLQEQQIYLEVGQFFEDQKGKKEQRCYVHDFYLQSEKRLAKLFGGPAEAAPPRKGQDERLRQMRGAAWAEDVPVPAEVLHWQPTQGVAVTATGLETSQGGSPARDQARDALEELETWATNPDAPPFFALLGEYGIGKTTTLKQFTRRLLEKREQAATDRPPLPLPLYIDLREYVSELPEQVPTIDQLLEDILKRSWKLSDRAVTASDVLRLVREEGALIIFDGLDEKIVHLPPAKAQGFIRTLWAVLPDAASGKRRDKSTASGRRGKMVVSCRSHYFRDVMSQNAMLFGEYREGLDARSYPALCLLPFTEAQIRGYLESFLQSPERAAAAFDLIAGIHNLPDLAQRPFLLSLIAAKLEQLESMSVRGETLNAARLYDLFVHDWLYRDNGKHQIDPAHKRRLMEDLAAALWRSGTKQWDADRLEYWLDEYLDDAANRVLAGAYQTRDRNLLKEDLRTATFVLRPDTEEKCFRFAHTSLQEFFLAGYLARALRDCAVGRWDLPMPSLETLDFLGQILAWGQPAAELTTLNAILGGDCLKAATMAFRYWLLALEKELPTPQPRHVKLAGADLEKWRIHGPAGGPPLNLRGANLAGTRLNRARLENVDLAGADLAGLEARQALFLDVRAETARATRADFSGLQWRGGSLAGSDLMETLLAGCQWIDVDQAGAALPEHWTRQGSAVEILHPIERDPGAALLAVTGHAGGVNACAWSPDGRRLLSGSADKTLKVWDASGGQCLLTLDGHAGEVNACASSPDGRRLLSGSDDNTLKVWDVSGGQCLLTLVGHAGEVDACAWSPDGRRLLSGSADNTLKVWDASGGQCLLTLDGHSNWVLACAWSPDGRRLLSGSADKTLKVWDASGGQCLLTLDGHADWVRACAWSPDGRRLLSGSWDNTLKVWNASGGQCLFTLFGHANGVLACAWSPDGRRLLSGSYDNKLKVWDASGGQWLLTLDGHASGVRACAWSPDGRRLLSGSADNTLKVWDVSGGQCLLTLDGQANGVRACAGSPDGRRLLSGSSDNTLKVWDASGGQCLLTLDGHASGVQACAWSPDGRQLLSGSDDNTLKVWDASGGQCLLTLDGHASGVQACAWSPDGRQLLSGSDDNTLKVWDASGGQCLLTLDGHVIGVLACAWSPDGRRLLSGSYDKTLKVWDASGGQCLLTLDGHASGVPACAWSPDSRRLLSGSADNTLKVWDASGGQCLLTLDGHASSVLACAWSPDGRRLLSGSADNTLKVWDASGGQCLLTLDGHASSVLACAWSPDGRRLLSGSADNTLKAWDAESGQCLWTGHLFPERQFAAVDAVTGQVTHASPEAWRFLGWRWFDPELGEHRLLPAETFGPLPA